MKVSKFRDMTNIELDQELVNLKQEIFNLNVRSSTGQLEDTKRTGRLKKDIARINTVLRERQIEEEKSEKDSNKKD
ncbi:MAG: 50S ribosomal protein L29 [bacterium]|nr:50S ribosomal protein L29 [bacterium]